MFSVTGLNFKTAPISLRERVYFREEQKKKAYGLLKEYFEQGLILSTCNRVELYSYGREGEKSKDLIKKSIHFLEQFHGLSEDVFKPYLFSLHGSAAILHVLKVAGGLLSMVLGENQILGQLKRAYQEALAMKSTGSELSRIFELALTCGKRIRSETKINEGGSSLGSVSIDLIKELYEKQDALNIVVLGAGEIASEILRSLSSFEKADIVLINRSKANAQRLRQKFGDAFSLRVENFESRAVFASSADVLISAIEAEKSVLEYADFHASRGGKTRSLLLIDLALPRSIASSIGKLDGVILYSIDDLSNVIRRTKQKRYSERDKAMCIVSDVEEEYQLWERKQSFFRLLSSMKGDLLDAKKKALLGYMNKANSGHVEAMEQRLRFLSKEKQHSMEDVMDSFLKKLLAKKLGHLKENVSDAAKKNRKKPKNL